MANRDMDRTIRILERDEQQMRKALEAQNRKLVLISNHSGIALSGEGVRQDLAAEVSSLQSSLR